VQKHRSLEGFKGADAIDNEELLTLDVDVLVPAALENVITTKNAPKIRAKVICEGANGPTTAAADADPRREGDLRDSRHPRECGRRDRVVLRVGAGPHGLLLERRRRERTPGDIMTRSFRDVLQLSQQHNVNMRTAAYMLSISRVATVHRLRGIYA
jgi:glutamate dehydrogenase (NAD(P)+)